MASASTSADVWADYEALTSRIPTNTMDRLKQMITGFNDEMHLSMAKSGRKQDLIDRIRSRMQFIKTQNDVAQWEKAKRVLYQVKVSGQYTPAKYASSTSHIASPGKMNGYSSPANIKHNPYAPAPYASVAPMTPYGARAPATRVNHIAFKPSPFFRVDELVSQIVEGPESMNNNDRRQATVNFTLTPEQEAKLKSENPKYQLRLYCTSATYYSPSTYRANSELCPIEFPPTCEIRVNGMALNANTKGLKKKPGTAPPADLSKVVKPSAANRLEMIYVNSTANPTNTPAKKYYVVVMLTEVTPIDTLVDRLKKGKYRSCNDILAEMKAQAADDDDDIVAGPQKMSLRDSLTMVRVATPARSKTCVHPSCFDATTWFMMMETTTTWQCPICDKVLDPDDLIIDGYFESIINATPEDCDDVMVEADGEWHTNDNTYASEAWKKAHPPKVEAAVAQRRSPTPARSTPAVVYTLDDSDDEDEEGRVKRELSPSFRNGLANSSFSSIATLPPMSRMSHTPMPPSRQASKVIDLTSLDSDDEDISVAPTPPPLSVPKYTLSSPHTFQTASLTTPLPRMPSHSDHPLPPRPSLSAMNHLSAIERPEKRKAPDDYNGADLTWKRPRPSDGNSTPYTNGHGIPLSPLSSPSNGYAGTSYHRPLVRTSDPYTGAAYPSPASSSSTQATNGSRYPSYGYS